MFAFCSLGKYEIFVEFEAQNNKDVLVYIVLLKKSQTFLLSRGYDLLIGFVVNFSLAIDLMTILHIHLLLRAICSVNSGVIY